MKGLLIQTGNEIGDNKGVRFSAATHVGHVRSVNEDSIVAIPEIGVWSVSDGMGGHSAGDYASQTVIEAISAVPEDLPPVALMESLRNALKRAHEIIRQDSPNDTTGATVVTLAIARGHFVSFWVGDSRLYLFRDGDIQMLTTDHSLVADLVLSGQLTWDEAEHHPQSNAITRAVGVGEALEIDKVRGEVQKGDRFLLCSDGLTKYADSVVLSKILGSEPIETVVDTLMTLALDMGGADNISIIVVDT